MDRNRLSVNSVACAGACTKWRTAHQGKLTKGAYLMCVVVLDHQGRGIAFICLSEMHTSQASPEITFELLDDKDSGHNLHKKAIATKTERERHGYLYQRRPWRGLGCHTVWSSQASMLPCVHRGTHVLSYQTGLG